MNPPPTVFQRRIVIGAVICVAAFLLVGMRLVDVTVFTPNVRQIRSGDRPILSRADIVDRNGELIARNLPADDLYARPELFKDKIRAAHELAVATGVEEERLTQLFAGKHNYVLVARQLPPDVRTKVRLLNLPGLEYQADSKRYYPDGRLAAQVVGVTDGDDKGVSGLELGLNRQLRDKPMGAADQVQTSLDMRVQFILAHEAKASLDEFHAHAAGGLVMNVRTGEILAFVSLPDFDPNTRNFGDGNSSRDIMAQNLYELGSVFKIFTFAMALQDHTIHLGEEFPIGNGLKIGRYTIHEAERMPATLTVQDILADSSNIGAAQIAMRSGAVRQRAFLTTLGLLSPIHTELPENASPLYPSNWGTIETATIGFGHGISVTPLAFAAAAASVVNGGRRITPTFLKHPSDARGEQVISPETSATMRGLLRYVVTNGTGKKADVPGYDVGGKTGSAEVVGPNGRYMSGKLVTSFCGVFPVDDPRYLVFVVMDRPHGTKATDGFALAGYTAVPLAGQVISRIAPLLGVPMTPVTVAKENS
ncbi:MAG: penicillin-binding protein 2 [Alphaproteobacteria bacterium]|nr:penicillin-binding protein 2 [Alphaproteobacteria bacterium]MDE2163955.1 penicillin-binding protein 2 [Alphaproteobacteria bacterium]MDE2264386.1 penicillin-binding protein 2 [Alphaproteobacteria bacterium]MDE2500038.1 penicillin-binding protein 2 [Alphaproteobacteria bacterium]